METVYNSRSFLYGFAEASAGHARVRRRHTQSRVTRVHGGRSKLLACHKRVVSCTIWVALQSKTGRDRSRELLLWLVERRDRFWFWRPVVNLQRGPGLWVGLLCASLCSSPSHSRLQRLMWSLNYTDGFAVLLISESGLWTGIITEVYAAFVRKL